MIVAKDAFAHIIAAATDATGVGNLEITTTYLPKTPTQPARTSVAMTVLVKLPGQQTVKIGSKLDIPHEVVPDDEVPVTVATLDACVKYLAVRVANDLVTYETEQGVRAPQS